MGVHRLVEQRVPDLIVGWWLRWRTRTQRGSGSYRTRLSRFV